MPPTSASAPTAPALLLKEAGVPMEAALAAAPLVAALGAAVFGWFCVRLSGVYLAMLTLAFAQIVWSVVFQWDAFTGGSNGLVGIWPAAWLAPKPAYYLARPGAVRRWHRSAASDAASRRSASAARQPRLAAALRRDRHRRAARCSGSPSSSPARSPASPARCSRSPRARSRPRRSASPRRSTAW